MPRVPTPDRQELPEAKRDVYDEIVGSRGSIVGPFGVLLNSPEAARRIAHLGAYIRFESTLSPATREIAILVAGREADCQFEWTYHEPEAREAGVSAAAITSIRDKRDIDGLSDDEAIPARYCQELIRNKRVSAETFQQAHQRLGDQGITELTATVGYYTMLACVLNAMEVEPEAGVKPLLPL